MLGFAGVVDLVSIEAFQEFTMNTNFKNKRIKRSIYTR